MLNIFYFLNPLNIFTLLWEIHSLFWLILWVDITTSSIKDSTFIDLS